MIDDSILRQFPDNSPIRPLDEESISQMLNRVFTDEGSLEPMQKQATDPGQRILDTVLGNYRAGTISAEDLATFALAELAGRAGSDD